MKCKLFSSLRRNLEITEDGHEFPPPLIFATETIHSRLIVKLTVMMQRHLPDALSLSDYEGRLIQVYYADNNRLLQS